MMNCCIPWNCLENDVPVLSRHDSRISVESDNGVGERAKTHRDDPACVHLWITEGRPERRPWSRDRHLVLYCGAGAKNHPRVGGLIEVKSWLAILECDYTETVKLKD